MGFLVPKDNLVRLPLLLTLTLCMINTLNSVVTTSPKSGGKPTALIIWIWSCLVFIIMAILEYSTLLYYSKVKSNKDATEGKKEIKATSKADSEEKKFKNLDMLMLAIFPSVFLIYSLIFWLSFYANI